MRYFLPFAAVSASALLMSPIWSADSGTPPSQIEAADGSSEKGGTSLKNPGPNEAKEPRTQITGALEELSAFIEENPDSPKAADARLIRAQILIDAPDSAETGVSAAEAIADIQSLLAGGNLAPTKKPGVHLLLLRYFAKHRSGAELEAEMDRYETENPDAPLPTFAKTLLADKLEETNPERAKQLRDEASKEMAEMRAAKERAAEKMKSHLGKPVELKFTAVDGTSVNLQAMKGKVVLLDFWATWCGPCVAELPTVLAAYEKYRDEGFEIVGISFDREKKPLLKMIEEKDMAWPQYFHEGEDPNPFGEQFGIHGIPTMWLVNKDGVLVDLDGRHDLDAKVGRLLAE